MAAEIEGNHRSKLAQGFDDAPHPRLATVAGEAMRDDECAVTWRTDPWSIKCRADGDTVDGPKHPLFHGAHLPSGFSTADPRILTQSEGASGCGCCY